MKRKSTSKTKPKRKNEFRYHETISNSSSKGKHPAYIWQERGNMYDYHGLTHSSKIEGVILKKLRTNPNPDDTRDSYYDVNSKEDLKSRFGKKRKKWKLDPEDQKEIHNK